MMIWSKYKESNASGEITRIPPEDRASITGTNVRPVENRCSCKSISDFSETSLGASGGVEGGYIHFPPPIPNFFSPSRQVLYGFGPGRVVDILEASGAFDLGSNPSRGVPSPFIFKRKRYYLSRILYLTGDCCPCSGSGVAVSLWGSPATPGNSRWQRSRRPFTGSRDGRPPAGGERLHRRISSSRSRHGRGSRIRRNPLRTGSPASSYRRT